MKNPILSVMSLIFSVNGGIPLGQPMLSAVQSSCSIWERKKKKEKNTILHLLLKLDNPTELGNYRSNIYYDQRERYPSHQEAAVSQDRTRTL